MPTCPECGQDIRLTKAGALYRHGDCPGGGQPPVESTSAAVGPRLPAGAADNRGNSPTAVLDEPQTAVYLVRPSNHNEELRYSLRSLVNTPVDRVVIVGHCPPGIQPDAYVRTDQSGDKAANLRTNYRAAIDSDEVPEQFSLWWDDIFAMQPTRIEPLHRGLLRPLVDRMRRQRGPTGYWKGIAAAAELLDDQALAYEPLHVPHVVTKASVAKALDMHSSHNGLKTVIGNLDGIGGTEHPNAKNPSSDKWPDLIYLSTSNKSFGKPLAGGRWSGKPIGAHIRKHFREPSRWEVQG